MAYEMSRGFIALKRLGYGSKANGDVAEADADPRGFVKSELERPDSYVVSDTSLPNSQYAIAKLYEQIEVRKELKEKGLAEAKASGGTADAMKDPDNAAGKPQAQKSVLSMLEPGLRQLYGREALARAQNAVKAKVGIGEKLVAFWSNHFCVSTLKGPVGRIATGCFEREAIRPHILGKFEDMVLAVEGHPAMLNYLDNAKSIGPNSRAGMINGRGLNENLGREIMELHTLGAGSGYTQSDVTNLARILTGWTIVRSDQQKANVPVGSFWFNPRTHEPGTITLLGKAYPDRGVAQGRAALKDIARRPEVAHFIATKFARAFVADVPPKPLVDRLAQTFLTSKGDLKALTFALIDAPDTWTPAATRMTTPYDFLVGYHRLLGLQPENPRDVVPPLRDLGMPLWTPPGPNGFPVVADVWASPEGMKLRLDYCARIAERLPDPPNPNDLLEAMCGGAPSQETKVAVSRAESRPQGIALLLMSPEMQRS